MVQTPKLNHYLELERCPHCSVRKPTLTALNTANTKSHDGKNERYWTTYVCSVCGGVVLAAVRAIRPSLISEIHPALRRVDKSLPERASHFLRQAIECIHSPSGAVMLAGSAVDAMLKERGYTEGSLYSRVNKATIEHVLTEDMAKWAHEVRLDANDQRHADITAELPTEDYARKVIDFAEALGQILFVLPARVRKGLKDAEKD